MIKCFISFLILSVFSFGIVSAQSIFAGQTGQTMIYYDVNPDASVVGLHNNGADGYYMDIDINGVFDFKVVACDCSGLGGGSPNATIYPLNGNEVSVSYFDTCYSFGLDSALSYTPIARPYVLNEEVDNNGEWVSEGAKLNYSKFGVISYNSDLYSFYCYDSTFTLDSRYIGVRIILPLDTLYGWIKVKNVSSRSATVEEHSCEQQILSVGYNKMNASIKLFPNPVTSKFKIVLPFSGNRFYTLFFYNLQGQILIAEEFFGNELDIDIGNFVSGIYFVKIVTSEYTEIRKIIKSQEF